MQPHFDAADIFLLVYFHVHVCFYLTCCVFVFPEDVSLCNVLTLPGGQSEVNDGH